MTSKHATIEPLENRIAPAVAVFPLSSLDGINGFTLSGVAARNYAGSSVSDAGDVNGDGFADLIICARGPNPEGSSAGSSYVIFGKEGGFPAVLELASLDGTTGFKIAGDPLSRASGMVVSAAGDVNGDGFADLLVGAPDALGTGGNAGAGYVIFGKASGFTAELGLSSLNGSNGFKLAGVSSYDRAGFSVSAAGDVNGDGFDDVIIGAVDADPNGVSSGAAYVVFGKASGFQASVSLSSLNGSNGFKLSGVAERDAAGRSVSGAGDINNDGFADIIIGARKAEVGAMSGGAAYVVYGKASGFGSNVNLSTLNGTNGFKLTGASFGDYAGHSVSAAGDVNGDGFDDVVIGAYGVDGATGKGGATYVVFGKATAFGASVSLGTINGTNGFKVVGNASNTGYSVSNAGDFNGDGFDDILIGSAPYSSSPGASYLVFGKASGFAASTNLDSLNGANGFRIEGTKEGEMAGQFVSTAGDVNGDGFDDVIVGAPNRDWAKYNEGAAYVIFGSAQGPLPALSVSDVTVIEPATGTATASFTITLSSASSQTVTVQYATADGSATAGADYRSVPLSTLTFAPGQTSKTVTVSVLPNDPREVDETFFVNLVNPVNANLGDPQGVGTISDKSAPFQLSTLNGVNGFKIDGQAIGDRAGASVSDAGDINGDGFADFIIGAPLADPRGQSSGASYVVFGKAGGFGASFSLSTLNGANGFKITGVAAGDYAGSSVSAAGDVNGDGFDDLVVGAPGSDLNGYSSGSVYVIFGKATGFASNLVLNTLNGTNGFELRGKEVDRFGSKISGAGDFNGDGFADLLIGLSSDRTGGHGAGLTYVIYGKEGGYQPVTVITSLSESERFRIIGAAGGDSSGYSVSTAGDVNGDGIDDIIVGAFLTDAGASDSGASYVLFGREEGFTGDINLGALDGQNGFRIGGFANGDRSGGSVSNAGDVNGDGYGDLIIGAPRASAGGWESGAAYVVFGKAEGFGADLNLSALDGTNGFKMSGVAFRDNAGSSVSGAGDFNGDGFDDVIVGAYMASPNGERSGSSYIIFGKADGFVADLDLTKLNGGNGFRLDGSTAWIHSGMSVSGAGDVNGDGFDDVVIGGADFNGENRGTSYVVFGKGVEFSISDAVATEGSAGTSQIEFTISISEAAEYPVSVSVSSQNGTALAGSDFTGLGLTTLTFAPGETSKTVAVTITGDALFETDETFSLVLSDARAGVIRDGVGIGTIMNDDAPPVATITGGAMLEGNDGNSAFVFTVTLDAPSGLPATLQYSTSDGTATAGEDYLASQGSLIFAPGETVKTFSIPVIGDTSMEDHEHFAAQLSLSTDVTIVEATAEARILNDDTIINIEGGSVPEGDEGMVVLTYLIRLEKESALPVSVYYGSSPGTASAGSDFAPTGDVLLTFVPGEMVKKVEVQVSGDREVEPDETFTATLSNAAGGTIGTATATGTILNDDTQVRIDDVSILEGHSGNRSMTFTVSLSMATLLPVSVMLESIDGTAIAGVDYVGISPVTLDFAPGETSRTVTVEILGDIEAEDTESFTMVLGNAVNASIEGGTAVGTILNDDVTLLSGRTATYVDEDGDIVTIKVNKGTLKVEDFTLLPAGVGSRLALVNFSGESEFAGANLTISAKRAFGAEKGPRSADVGHIDASGINLGKVAIKGDLGRIDAGDELSKKPGVLSLVTNSMGLRGDETQLPGGSLQSQIAGTLKTVKISGSVAGADLSASGDLKSVKIGGDLLSSTLRSDGRIGSIQINGDVFGTAERHAQLTAQGLLFPASAGKAAAIGKVKIGGSVDYAQILSGHDRTGMATNADAGIQSIMVGGDWTRSDVAAGAVPGADGYFGTDDDERIAAGNSIVARIASIQIRGIVSSPAGSEESHYGFTAEEIRNVKIGGDKVSLQRGASNDLASILIGGSTNVAVRELS